MSNAVWNLTKAYVVYEWVASYVTQTSRNSRGEYNLHCGTSRHPPPIHNCFADFEIRYTLRRFNVEHFDQSKGIGTEQTLKKITQNHNYAPLWGAGIFYLFPGNMNT